MQKLRVIIWSHHVMAASGLTVIQEFEDLLAKRSQKTRLSKGLWPRYMRGEVIPQGAQTPGRPTLIDRIDGIYPGTAQIFRAPLWDLMNFDQVLGPQELKRMYLHLDEKIWTRFVGHSNSTNTSAVEASRYWRPPMTEGARQVYLRQLQGFEGLSACLIEARMGYLMQDETMFINSMVAGQGLLNALAGTQTFSPKRMQSAILLLEGYWVRHVKEQVVIPPTYRDVPRNVFAKGRAWEHDWTMRAKKHSRTLSKSSKAVFSRWQKECISDDR